MLFLPYDVFSGEPVDLSTILVEYTYLGDVNLDGCVDDNDITFINLFYDGGVASNHYWNEGDIFGYDGRIDDNDMTILNLTYGAGWLWGEPLGVGDPLGTVPEPATLALAALGGLGILLRRKQSREGETPTRQRAAPGGPSVLLCARRFKPRRLDQRLPGLISRQDCAQGHGERPFPVHQHGLGLLAPRKPNAGQNMAAKSSSAALAAT
jgi:hypothetical protein